MGIRCTGALAGGSYGLMCYDTPKNIGMDIEGRWDLPYLSCKSDTGMNTPILWADGRFLDLEGSFIPSSSWLH
jgi:hypothetical protein